MRQAERIKEKVTLRLEGRQIATFVAFGLAVGVGVFFAGYVIGQQNAPKPPPIAATVLPSEPSASPGLTGTTPAAPATPPPPKYTYDRTLTLPTPRVEVDDPTLQIADAKREEMERAETDADKKVIAEYASDLPAKAGTEGQAGSAFLGRKIETDPVPVAVATDSPPAQAVGAESETEHAESDDNDKGDVGDAEASDKRGAGEPVRVEMPDDEPVAPKGETSPLDAKGKGFTIQIKAFREKDEAREFMAMLVQSGHKPYLVTADVPGKGRFYRVRLGKYDTQVAADRKRKAFEKAEGFQTIVTAFQ